MVNEDLPRWLAMILIGILLLIIALPYIVDSQVIKYNKYIQYEQGQQIRPLTINQLITLYSEEYKVDEKLARDIIHCESRFKPYALNIKAVVGEDVGLFQLNSYYWQEQMALNGWDIYNVEDNIEAGMWLLSKSGSDPWIWSEHCWSKR